MSSNKIVYQRNLSKVYSLTLFFHTRSPLKVRHLESQGSGVEGTQNFHSREGFSGVLTQTEGPDHCAAVKV